MTLDQVHFSNAQHDSETMLRHDGTLHSLAESCAQLACPLAPSDLDSEDVRWSWTGTIMQNVQDIIIAQADTRHPQHDARVSRRRQGRTERRKVVPVEEEDLALLEEAPTPALALGLPTPFLGDMPSTTGTSLPAVMENLGAGLLREAS